MVAGDQCLRPRWILLLIISLTTRVVYGLGYADERKREKEKEEK